MRIINLATAFALACWMAAPVAAQTAGAAVSASGNVSTAPSPASNGNVNANIGPGPGASVNANLATAPRWGINGSGAPASYGGMSTASAAALQTPGAGYGGPAMGYGNMTGAGANGAGNFAYPSSRWSMYAPATGGRAFSNFGGRTFARGYYTMQAPGYGYGIYNNPYSFSAASTNQGLFGSGHGTNGNFGFANSYGMNAGSPIGAGAGSAFGGNTGSPVGNSSGNVPAH